VSGPKSTTNGSAVAGLLVSESRQNTNTPSHAYPHPEREETVADEPPEVQPYKKQGGELLGYCHLVAIPHH